MRHSSLRRSLLPVVSFVIAAALALPAAAQDDLIGAPGPLTFEGTEFALAWTGATEAEAVQEYLPEGQALESYDAMFIIRTATTGNTPLVVAQNMAAGLEERRGTDPVVNYDLIENKATGEVLLDFLISDSSSGSIVVEWNAYRYAPLDGGVVGYAISRRGYGDDGAKTFLTELKDWRQNSITALATMELPEVAIPE
ncbi:hypothetical protein [Devosia lacusdianchii]|uniref:hypothetical protein n=1 Tax=Devosia lacusdianchii TaxID=2917991 RepID=UPI001F055864|nr:hypothetical protein [Devosia sp. JXJ CY 41]